MTPLIEPRPKTALAWQDEEIAYPDVIRRARARAASMPEAGERVVLFAENCPDWVYSAYGAWVAGAVLVPVDHLSTAPELAYVVDDCRPVLVVCSEHTRATVEGALAIASTRPRVATFQELQAEAAAREGAPHDAQATAPITVDEPSLAAIVYTSGTTGSPKGVMLSFGNLLANIRPVADAGYYTPAARVLLLLPLHHVLPLAGCLTAPLYAGSTIVFATSLAGPDLVGLLRRHRITLIVGVPRFYDLLNRALRERIDANPVARGLFALARRVRSPKFSKLLFGSVHRKFGGSLEYLVSGGAALSPATGETFDVLGFKVCEGYGMTECAPMITFPRPEAIKLGSCGQALTGCEVRVDESGEILARGPNVMLGYYGHPEETRAILRDGWLHTGDLGRLDEEGYLYVTGRLKDILVLPSGKKVDPEGVETVLRASPGVREVGVFLDGETLHALVGPDWDRLAISDRATAEATLRRDVIDPYNAGVSPYRRVARLTLVHAELPRTRLGKLRRHLLPGIAEEVARTSAIPGYLDAPADSALARLAAFLSGEGGKPVRADSRLEADLGVDSLGRVELSVFMERAFGVSIPENRLAEVETVGDLARFVAEYRKEEGATPPEAVSWAEILHPKTPPALPGSGLAHRALTHLLRWGARTFFRIEARGLERLPAAPFVLVPNHQSYLDGLFVAAHLPAAVVLNTVFYAKEKHVRVGWLRWLAAHANTIVMHEKAGFLPSLQQLAEALRQGRNLMIFPEGTRSRDGTLGEFKESYAILARELKVPVVPVAIDGATGVLPPGRHFPRLSCPITVTCLDPVHPEETASPAELNATVRQRIAAEVRVAAGSCGG